MTDPNDFVRRAILRYLHEIYLDHTGSHRSETEDDRLTADIRKRTGIAKALVVANINYLADRGLISQRRASSKDGAECEGKRLYGIAGPGMARIEPACQFEAYAEHQELHEVLIDIRKVIDSAQTLGDAARRDVIGDIDTVRAQLGKVRPNETVIKAAWEGIEIAVGSLNGTQLLERAALQLFPKTTSPRVPAARAHTTAPQR